MLLVLNNLSFVYLGSASWEEFVRKSELESENSTFKLRLVNYDHYHQIKKYYIRPKRPVSPTRARPQRHPPSGEKSSKLSCPEMGLGAFYMFGIYWLLGGFRRGPNCVTHITHSHILCTVPLVCFWTNKTESKMSRVTGVRLHFACACAQRSGIVLLWPNNEETMQSVGSLLECYFSALVSNLRNGVNKNVNIFDTHVIYSSITHL